MELKTARQHAQGGKASVLGQFPDQFQQPLASLPGEQCRFAGHLWMVREMRSFCNIEEICRILGILSGTGREKLRWCAHPDFERSESFGIGRFAGGADQIVAAFRVEDIQVTR